MERVDYIQTEFDSPALIEEYIEGREIYAAILGSYENARRASAGRARPLQASQGRPQNRQPGREIREGHGSL